MKIVTNYSECKEALAEAVTFIWELHETNSRLVDFQSKLFMIVQEKGSISKDDLTHLAIEKRVAEASSPAKPQFEVR